MILVFTCQSYDLFGNVWHNFAVNCSGRKEQWPFATKPCKMPELSRKLARELMYFLV